MRLHDACVRRGLRPRTVITSCAGHWFWGSVADVGEGPPATLFSWRKWSAVGRRRASHSPSPHCRLCRRPCLPPWRPHRPQRPHRPLLRRPRPFSRRRLRSPDQGPWGPSRRPLRQRRRLPRHGRWPGPRCSPGSRPRVPSHRPCSCRPSAPGQTLAFPLHSAHWAGAELAVFPILTRMAMACPWTREELRAGLGPGGQPFDRNPSHFGL